MRTLDELALAHGTDKGSTHHDYTRAYERMLSDRRDRVTAVLEFGVYQGASLQMWRDYCPQARIVGVDLNPIEVPGATVIAGSAVDPDVVRFVGEQFGPFDLVVDDASHVPGDQVATVDRAWQHVAPGGFYVIEDTCCAYWPEYGDGELLWAWLRRRQDTLNLRGERAHGNDRRLSAVQRPLSMWEQTLEAIHIFNSMIWLEKREA